MDFASVFYGIQLLLRVIIFSTILHEILYNMAGSAQFLKIPSAFFKFLSTFFILQKEKNIVKAFARSGRRVENNEEQTCCYFLSFILFFTSYICTFPPIKTIQDFLTIYFKRKQVLQTIYIITSFPCLIFFFTSHQKQIKICLSIQKLIDSISSLRFEADKVQIWKKKYSEANILSIACCVLFSHAVCILTF